MIIGSGGQEARHAPPGERRLCIGDVVATELTTCVKGRYAQLERPAMMVSDTSWPVVALISLEPPTGARR